MRAAVFDSSSSTPGHWLSIEEVDRPAASPGHILLKVLACGVCRTDLHIVEGDLMPTRPRIIPGHQIVGEVVDGATAELPLGTRAGVSWVGGADGDCWYCLHATENLCDHPVFTGYTVDGGYAEYAWVRTLNLDQTVTEFPLEDANRALDAVKHETADGSAVITVHSSRLSLRQH